ncbi:MAG: thiolase family protein, partial [Geodermatophilaceae bacterium]
MTIQDSVVIVDGARTAVGTYGGAFKATTAHELAAPAIVAALERAGVAPDAVDDVVLGCVGQVGPDAFNARRAALAAGLPAQTNAYNVNRLCGSGLQALWCAAMELRLGECDVAVAGGNENMTMQPFLDYSARDGYRLGHRTVVDGTLSLVTDPWGSYAMGVTAENVAERFHVDRASQDEFAATSQERAAKAAADGVFAAEIVPVEVADGKGTRTVDVDEHPRASSTVEKLARLRPAFREDGTVTAGNSSGINDGAAALVLMREADARAQGLKPKARIVAFAKGATEPEIMGYAPVQAIQRVIEKSGIPLENIGIIELNEAFAAQAIACVRAAEMDPDKVNPSGGAIALGHPVGATG